MSTSPAAEPIAMAPLLRRGLVITGLSGALAAISKGAPSLVFEDDVEPADVTTVVESGPTDNPHARLRLMRLRDGRSVRR